MIFWTLFFLCTFSVIGNVHSQAPTVQNVTIRPTEPGSTLPENKMAKQCGGAGSLVQQRNILCSDPECKVKPEQLANGQDMVLESEFIPSRDIKFLGYRITIGKEGETPIVAYDEKVPGSTVTTGSSYTVQLTIKPSPLFSGRVKGVYEIYDLDDKDKTVDICVEVHFDFL